MNRKLARLSLTLAVALLAGCGTSPKTNFYTLDALTLPGQTTATVAAPYTIGIGPVTIPDIIDRPQLITRLGSNQVAINEFERWAEPLQNEIPRLIAGQLRQLLGAQVSTYPQTTTGKDLIVTLEVQHFESAPGDAATIEVLWTLRTTKEGPAQQGRALIREPVGGAGYEALVAAHGRALTKISQEIAAAIRLAKP
ncbi:MAG: ABC-type transport auxiliary lipoprotein family protein [Betaproteobacteria bacterium]